MKIIDDSFNTLALASIASFSRNLNKGGLSDTLSSMLQPGKKEIVVTPDSKSNPISVLGEIKSVLNESMKTDALKTTNLEKNLMTLAASLTTVKESLDAIKGTEKSLNVKVSLGTKTIADEMARFRFADGASFEVKA